MTDSRPAPEYGEYASPEEQAAASGVPPVPLPTVPSAPVAGTVHPEVAPRRWDLMLCLALIAVGAYVTLSSLGQYADFAGFLGTVYASYGYEGSYPDSGFANAVGLVINVVQPVVLVLVIWWTMRRLRTGRLSFWIPLTGGAVVTVVLLVGFAIVLAQDPGFTGYFEGVLTGATPIPTPAP